MPPPAPRGAFAPDPATVREHVGGSFPPSNWAAMKNYRLLGSLGVAAWLLAGPLHALERKAELQRLNASMPLGFAGCATYYFLAARGHSAKEYDALYRAGEFGLNQASVLEGAEMANRGVETHAAALMQEMASDWRKIAVLDRQYAEPCAALMLAAGFKKP